MPRGPRIVAPSLPHHVITRGNDRRFIFHDDEDRHTYLRIVGEIKKERGIRVYHYVLMGNHVHLLIEPVERGDLSEAMQRINLRYSLAYKRKYGIVGHLWQGRFASFVVDNDSYLLTCGIYIELNPVRANIVSAPEDYLWSSYRAYAMDAYDPLLDDNPLMPRTTERSRVYRQLAEEWMRLKLSP